MSRVVKDEEALIEELLYQSDDDSKEEHKFSSSTLSVSFHSDDDSSGGDDTSSSHNSASSSDYDIQSYSSSSVVGGGSDDEGLFWELAAPLFNQVSAMRRRRNTAVGESTNEDTVRIRNEQNNIDTSSIHSKQRKRPLTPRGIQVYRERCPGLWGRRGNILLGISFLLWLLLQVTSGDGNEFDEFSRKRQSNAQTLMEKIFQQRQKNKRLTPGEIAQMRKQRQKEAQEALGSAAGGGMLGNAGNGIMSLFRGGNRKSKKGHIEDLPPGCEYTKWQKQSFPNCNELHAINLRDAFHLHKYSPNVAIGEHVKPDNNAQEEAKRVGYVGSGLWRHVWKVDPHDELMDDSGVLRAPAVLKMMKGEHDVNDRNMDRHRRDALVMERLTSSPYIVSMYAYCGNTVLTEYVGADLDAVVYDNKSPTPKLTRDSPEGRLRMALGIVKGIQALHEIDGGPIIHADIGWKQFLVSDDGTIKLNDFNRCRFIPRKSQNSTARACDVRIPSAPGNGRSPEEYQYKALSEQIDIYSAANVLFEILTGVEPWLGVKVSEAKNKVKHGEKPPIPGAFLTGHTTDTALASLIDLAYEHDPADRISAAELITELESLLAKARR
jgi:serine/threonine protein kinase